jgi:serine/threonine protein kinase
MLRCSGYMAPELIQAGTITLMSDIFGLGVIILEVITGHRDYPFDLRASAEEFINTVRKHNFEMKTFLYTNCNFYPT